VPRHVKGVLDESGPGADWMLGVPGFARENMIQGKTRIGRWAKEQLNSRTRQPVGRTRKKEKGGEGDKNGEQELKTKIE